jgi:hypothetical protein
MVKKLSLLMSAIAILVTAIPATASAVTGITSKAGFLAPVGSQVTWTNSGNVLITSSTLGTITCKTMTLPSELTVNNGTTFTGIGKDKGHAKGCTSGLNEATVTSLALTHFVTTETGAGTASLTITVDPDPESECTYTAASIPYTYVNGSSHFTFTKSGPIKGSPAFCGTATLDATFALEISGTAVILD